MLCMLSTSNNIMPSGVVIELQLVVACHIAGILQAFWLAKTKLPSRASAWGFHTVGVVFSFFSL